MDAGVAAFRKTGTLPVTEAEWKVASAAFTATRVDDDATLAEIKATYDKGIVTFTMPFEERKESARRVPVEH